MPRGDGPLLSVSRKLPLLYVLASLTLITASLYWAKAVLIPVALAIQLAFLLSPVVQAVRRIGISHVPAVLLVVMWVFAGRGGLSWTIFQQVAQLIDDLPRYESNIERKIADVRGAGKGSLLEKAQTAAKEVTEELQKS
jgi:predicted PurR-regulated permease PerM